MKKSGLEEYQIKGIIEKFDKHDINPVTISNDCYINKMPNPIDLIEDKMYYIWIAEPHYKSRLNRAT